MKIIFIRHGESVGNFSLANNIDYDINNDKLTELGKKQAIKTGNILKNYGKIDIIYHSPIKRCVETANLIASELKIKNLEENNLLIEGGELNHKFNGMNKKDRDDYMSKQKKYIKLNKDLQLELNMFNKVKILEKITNEGIKITNAKPNQFDIEKNCKKFLNHLKKQNHKKIIVVSHRGTIQMFIKILCNIDANNFLFKITQQNTENKIDVNNCSITGIIYKNNKFQLVFPPNTMHLD
ncbi:MAG: histidine phosphatase family protein [Gammaproteobacteria bacterium]|nr:histidine phosphatase family protein [Gammaproteobacteria bacterium]